jgi:ABC-type transport system substrate-binding protein
VSARHHRAGALAASVVLVVALLGACTDDKKPSVTASSGSVSSNTPVVGGTLRIGVDRPKTLDPSQISRSSQSELLLADLLFDGLTSTPDGGLTAEPAIAASWTASTDLKSWQFTLRDARFSNGRAITAADVKYSIERVAKLGATSLAALRIDIISGFTPFSTGAAAELTGVRVVDDRNVAFDLDSPLAVLPELLSAPEYGIVPKEAVEAASPAFASAPVSSGPFSFAGQQGDVVKLVRAAAGSAYLDGIDVHEYDTTALENAYNDFIAGQLDWSMVPNNHAEDAVQRFGAGNFRPFDAEFFYAFNLLDPTFADVRFRQAIIKAIDRTAIVKAVYGGIADPLGSLIAAGVAGHVDDACGVSCAFDPEASKALLAQTFPNGGIPAFNVDYVPGTGEDAVANTIVTDLAAVGITATLRSHTPEEYPQFAVSGQEQLFRIGAIGINPSPDGYLVPSFLSGSHDNVTGFSAAVVDQLLQSARATPDPAARIQLYQQAETAILGLAPIVPIAQFRSKAVASPKVRDLVVTVDGSFAGDKVWLG